MRVPSDDLLVPTRPSGDRSNAVATTAFVRRYFNGIQPPVVAATPPVGPCSGQLWWDTNDGQLYIWTGCQWVAASCCEQGTAAATVTVAAVPPANPVSGELWWSTVDDQLNVWTGSAWQSAVTVPPVVTPAGPNGAVQFNNSGAFGGSNAIFDPSGNNLTFNSPVVAASMLSVKAPDSGFRLSTESIPSQLWQTVADDNSGRNLYRWIYINSGAGFYRYDNSGAFDPVPVFRVTRDPAGVAFNYGCIFYGFTNLGSSNLVGFTSAAGIGNTGSFATTGAPVIFNGIPTTRQDQVGYVWRETSFFRIVNATSGGPGFSPPDVCTWLPGQVADLPAPGPSTSGARAVVFDALNRTGIVQGGGANIIPVFCDGTNWRSDLGEPAAPGNSVQFNLNGAFTGSANCTLDVNGNLNSTGVLQGQNVVGLTSVIARGGAFSLQTAGSGTRWTIGRGDAEGGGNTGSNLAFVRYNDSNFDFGRVLTLQRDTGWAVFMNVAQLQGVPFATLPLPGSIAPNDNRGARATILDGSATAVWGDVATGGGTAVLSVWCDGINWRIG